LQEVRCAPKKNILIQLLRSPTRLPGGSAGKNCPEKCFNPPKEYRRTC
jgi:hypothetical protein